MEILQAAELLGQALRNDAMVEKLNTAKELYNEDTELCSLMGDYDIKQQFIKSLFENEKKNATAIAEAQKEIEELYLKITSNENFIRLDAAQTVVSNMIGIINEIISKAILGDDGCTHNCSTCNGCH